MNQSDIDAGLEEPRYAPRPRPTPIPSAAWNDAPTYCLTVNDAWVSHILGALEVLDQDDTWQGNDDQRSAARDQVNEIMAALMQKCEDPMVDCCDQIRLRLNAAGQVESYNTGFAVWNVDIERDPREFVPLAQTHDLIEDSAEIVRQESAAMLVEVLWNMGHFGVIKTSSDSLDQYIEEWYTTWLIPVGLEYRQPLADICLQRIYDTAYRNTGGGSDGDWFGALNEDAVQDLRCTVFALLADDGSLSYDNWLALKTALLTTYGNTLTSIGYYLDNLLVLLGHQALTNMGRRDSIYSQRTTEVLVYDATGFDHTTCP